MPHCIMPYYIIPRNAMLHNAIFTPRRRYQSIDFFNSRLVNQPGATTYMYSVASCERYKNPEITLWK